MAWTVVGTLLFPALFALLAPNPDFILGVGSHSHEAGGDFAAHGSDGDEGHYSAVPGAPGHPADHDCQPCQILKFQAGFLPQAPLPLPAGTQQPHPFCDRTEPQRAACIAALPPSRAPPQVLV